MTDPNALFGALYDLVVSGSRGAATRALLGDGADSVLPAATLDAEALPAVPFLAWRQGPIATSERTLQLASVTWYAYDLAGEGDRRLNRIAAALATAYAGEDLADEPPIAASVVPLDGIEIDVGEPYPDDALGGLRALPITLSLTTT